MQRLARAILLAAPLCCLLACAVATDSASSSHPMVKGGEDPPPDTVADDPNARFHVKGMAGKCWSVDPKSYEVGIRTCAPVAEQKVQVVELADRVVKLKIGGRCVQPKLGFVLEAVPLVTADCTDDPVQRWMLDGDSIRIAATPDGKQPLLGEFPDFVAGVGDHGGREGSAVSVVATRRDESDYWEFVPDKGAPHYPTSGFVSVGTPSGLVAALGSASPGSVIEVARGSTLDLSDTCWLNLGQRVTLRGEGDYTGRRPIQPTARLLYHIYSVNDPRYKACLFTGDPDRERRDMALFTMSGEGARFTNLALEGPSTSTDAVTAAMGIMTLAHQDYSVPELAMAVDHSDIFGWQAGAVLVWGAGRPIPNVPNAVYPRSQCQPPMSTPLPVAIERNYIHANRKDGSGYGVAVAGNGRASIFGDTFMGNRHAITGTGDAEQSYSAVGNLVLFSSPKEYFGWGYSGYNQDFDVHGTGNPADSSCGSPHWKGGRAGERIEIVANSFFGHNRDNFQLRGAPCGQATFRRNVTRQSEGDTVIVKTCGDPTSVNFLLDDNCYSIADPTRAVATGDFNGDGVDDLFLATGAAWYVSFSGTTTWRFRALATDPIAHLRFGDFDGDGRTDVIRSTRSLGFTTGNGIQVRWGGEGEWQTLHDLDADIADVLVGDFDGDKRADLLVLNGVSWTLVHATSARMSWSGTNPVFALRAKDVAVGSFDLDGRDDVIVESGGKWHFVPAGAPPNGSVLLGPARDELAKVRFADVDGNGLSDAVRVEYTAVAASVIGVNVTTTSDVSYDARNPFTNVRSSTRYAVGDPDTVVRLSPLGRFDGLPGADLLVWRADRRLDLRSGAIDPLVLHSNADGVTKNEMY